MVTAKTRRMSKVWPHKLIPLEATWVSDKKSDWVRGQQGVLGLE